MYIKKRITKLKQSIRDFIVRLTGHRYYELLSPDHAPINFRVDIFGKAQYLKTDHALQYAYQRSTPLIWMNCIERNPKSPWVKEHKDI